MSLLVQVWGSALVTPTPPVFSVVLYHTEASGQRLLRRSVCSDMDIWLSPSPFHVHVVYEWPLDEIILAAEELKELNHRVTALEAKFLSSQKLNTATTSTTISTSTSFIARRMLIKKMLSLIILTTTMLWIFRCCWYWLTGVVLAAIAV